MFGFRVIKTCLAVALSILLARGLQLHTPQFAGVVAVLSVQPSIYRSVRMGLQQTASALMGGLVGAVALYSCGNSFLVMGIVTLVVMAIHVKIKWTNSLLVSVVIAINTMGTPSQSFGASALNQMWLVLIGTCIGTLINAIHRPLHQDRAEMLLTHSEGMLRALLYYLHLDVQERNVTAYSEMRKQIEEVRTYLERGKEISKLIHEDSRFRNSTGSILALFQTFDSLAERIRDLSKGLQKIDTMHQEIVFFEKAVLLLIHLQEHKISGKHIHSVLLKGILQKRMDGLWTDTWSVEGRSHSLIPFLQLYNVMQEYLQVLDSLPTIHLESGARFYPKIHGLKEKISSFVVVWNPVHQK